MPVIDAQVHCYERNHPGRPWTAVLHGPPEVTGPDMIKAMDAVGVDGALLVSVYTMYRFDESYAVEVQKTFPGRFGVIKPVDSQDPKVGDTIDAWKKNPGAVAIRIMMTPEVPTDAADPGINRVLAAAGRNGFPVNLLARGRMKQVAELAKRNPDTQIVIDHLGLPQPFEPPTPPNAWGELPDVLEVAKQPNAAIKVTGACTLSYEKFPYKDIWDPLARVFDAYGLDRCMWGTDWTRAVGVLNYREGVDAFRVTDRLSDSDRERLMGGTLTRIYKWAPKK